ncbi:unnamed protein product, partial [Heterosigma akashiwo]
AGRPACGGVSLALLSDSGRAWPGVKASVGDQLVAQVPDTTLFENKVTHIEAKLTNEGAMYNVEFSIDGFNVFGKSFDYYDENMDMDGHRSIRFLARSDARCEAFYAISNVAITTSKTF